MFILEIQDRLSVAQAFPILGPAIISPVKAIVSLVELVAGTALGSIAGIFGALTGSSDSLNFSFTALFFGGHGLLHLTYSALNIATLGIFGIFYLCSR